MTHELNPWYWLTLLGTPEWWVGVLVGVALFYALFRKNKRFKKNRAFFKGVVLLFLLSMLVSMAIVQGVKDFTAIPRPCSSVETDYCPDGYSFPSGHAAISFVLFGVVLFSRTKRLASPLLLFALLMSYSRLALGVHTTLDVTVGAVVGLGMTFAVSTLLRRKNLL